MIVSLVPEKKKPVIPHSLDDVEAGEPFDPEVGVLLDKLATETGGKPDDLAALPAEDEPEEDGIVAEVHPGGGE